MKIHLEERQEGEGRRHKLNSFVYTEGYSTPFILTVCIVYHAGTLPRDAGYYIYFL